MALTFMQSHSSHHPAGEESPKTGSCPGPEKHEYKVNKSTEYQ